MKKFEIAIINEYCNDILNVDVVYVNDKYQVNVFYINKEFKDKGLIHLSIKRKDKKCIHDWRDLQLIKNMICGNEREGLEIYPSESRLVDTSNQFHIWVLPKGEKIPFGYKDRLVVEGHDADSVQRCFNIDEKPVDCVTKDDCERMIKERFK